MKKVILVTGASSGIGYDSAKTLLQEGHIVYGGARRVERMKDLEAMAGHALFMDITNDNSVKGVVARVIEEQGRIDVLFANPGYSLLGVIECVDVEDAQKEFNVNVFGIARVVKAVLPQMRKQNSGTIIITSSTSGRVTVPGMGWYPASKHALEAFSDALRMEVKRFGIHVAIIEPGFISTDLLIASIPTLDKAEKSEYADVYKKEQENFRVNFTNSFNKGSPVETVSKVVSEITSSSHPRRRYLPDIDGRLFVLMKKLAGDGILDYINTRKMFESH